MLVGGATSVTCWYVPVALATIPQFNYSIPANQLWAIFCGLLVLVNAVAVLGFVGSSFIIQRGLAGGNAGDNLFEASGRPSVA